MTFIEKIRQGTLTRKRIVEPEGVQHCLNCGNDFEGAYCPHCGQSHDTRRISWHSFWRTFVMTGIGLQGTLPRTLIELFYRPGFLIRDYLAGKRQHYLNPFRCLLLLAAIFILFNNTLVSTDIQASASEFGMSVGQNMVQSEQEQAATQRATEEMMETIYGNFGTFNLLLIFVMTLPFWIVFSRQGQYRSQPLNLSEAATAMAYVGCQNMTVNLLSLPFIGLYGMVPVATVGYCVVIPLYIVTLWQLFDMKLLRFLWCNLLLTVLFLLFYIGAIYLFVVCLLVM